MSIKKPYTVELKDRQHEYLQRMAKKYDLPDEQKALRVIIDFAMHEAGDEERIFEKIRCSGC